MNLWHDEIQILDQDRILQNIKFSSGYFLKFPHKSLAWWNSNYRTNLPVFHNEFFHDEIQNCSKILRFSPWLIAITLSSLFMTASPRHFWKTHFCQTLQCMQYAFNWVKVLKMPEVLTAYICPKWFLGPRLLKSRSKISK